MSAVTFPLMFDTGHWQCVDNAEEQLDRRLPSSPGVGPDQVFPGVGHEPGGWQQHSAAPLHPPLLLRQGNPAPHLTRWQQVPALRQSGCSLAQSARAGAHWNVWWVFVEAFLCFFFVLEGECDCVCAHVRVRMHNCHLKRCFTSASFHPPCDCKKSSLKRQVVYFPHSSMTAKPVKGTSLVLTPHNLER